jgi:hypothetical protein
MDKWIDPIFDRDQDDIATRTAKAFFNVADWIRINGNTQQVQAVVNIMLGLSIPVTSLPEPSITTIPSVDDVNAFILNIERLRSAAAMPVGTGLVPLKVDYKAGASADAPDYNAVNDWERDVYLIRECLREAVEQVIYCGSFNCGQARLWAVNWRHWQGYVPDANDAHRMIRLGSKVGQGFTRQNRWRSLINRHRRVARCGLSTCGASIIRQNGFRRYA